MFPGAFEGKTCFPSEMATSVIEPEHQEEVGSISQLLYRLANRTVPGFVVGANFYVYAHLSGGFNPYVTYILNPVDIRGRLRSLGLNLSVIRGIYVLSYKGYLPPVIEEGARLLIVRGSFGLWYMDGDLAANFTEYVVVQL
ncbi:MAG: hypothetical protein DRK00_08780 [Thermoprotei archaeon]|nr:MAG: hypothetical protein DRK00_08780 [Thermoprotei archaeon]